MRIKSKLQTIIKRSAVLSHFKLLWFQKKWRKQNAHNLTTAANCFNARWVTVGNGTYGALDVRHFGNPEERVQIGNYCSIGPECVFMTGGEHPYDRLSTYPFRAKLEICENESVCRGPIILEDDVWLGFRVTVMSGVRIGKGAVVAAGAVVTKDVPPYAIVGGVPAKVIKYRFSSKVIEQVSAVNFEHFSSDKIITAINALSRALTTDNVEDIISELGC